MFDWLNLIENFSKFYYTTLMLFVVELIALIIAFKYGRKTKIGRAFIFYIAFEFFMLITGDLLAIHSGISRKNYIAFLIFSNTLIALVELLVYYYFISSILQSKKLNLLMKFVALLYTFLVIIFFITRFSFVSPRQSFVSDILGAIEFILLLPPCMLYFYSILNNNSELPLFQRPSFWIVTGIFYYSLISIPFFIINRYILNLHLNLSVVLGAVFYNIPFTVNFIFLIKAFLCKKPLTT